VSGNDVKGKVLTGWELLIQDAEQKVAVAKQRVIDLQRAAKDLRRIRDSGQRWPGARSARSETAATHN